MNKKTLSILTVLVLLVSFILPVFATDTVTYIAEIEGGEKFTTLTAAVAAAPTDGTLTTINLLANAEGSGVETVEGQNVVINFGGYTYNVISDLVGSTGTITNAFRFLKGSEVKMYNGTLKSAISRILVQNYSKLTVEDMTLDASESNGYTKYVLSNNFDEVEVIGNTSIKGGEFAFDVYSYATEPYLSGTTLTVNTTGLIEGKVSVEAAAAATVYNAKMIIENMNHNGDLVVPEHLKANMIIKGGAFTDLATAVAQVPADGTQRTIKLYTNVTDGAGIKTVSGQNVVIDFNGKTYNVTSPLVGSSGTESNGAQFLKGSTVTLKNGTFSSVTAAMLVQNYSNLTVTDMSLTTKDGVATYVLSNNCGVVNINGSTSITASTFLDCAMDMCWAPNKGYPEGTQITVDTTGKIVGKIELGVWGDFAENPKSTLTIKNVYHSGMISVTSGLEDQIEIFGGKFSNKIGDEQTDYLAPNRVCDYDETAGIYIVREREVASTVPTVGEETKETQAGIAEENLVATDTVLKETLAASGLTQEIDNKDLTVQVEVTGDYKAQVAEAIIEKIEEVAKAKAKELGKDVKTADYFDITVAVKTEEGTVGTLTELNNKIALTLSLSEELRKVPEGYNRVFFLIRHHIDDEGKETIEVIPTTKSQDGKSITGYSNLFSTYVLAYADEKVETTNNDKNNSGSQSSSSSTGSTSSTNTPAPSAPAATTTTTSNPATGDGIVVYFITLAVAIIGICAIVIIKAKRK